MMLRFVTIWIFIFSFLSVNSQVFYRADRLPVNSSQDNDMAPVFYKDGLVFSSNRKNDVVLVTTDQEGRYMYNLYFVKKKGGKNWGPVQLFAREIASRYNESSACFSNDGNTLYYMATINAGGKMGDEATGDTLKNGIFIASWNNDQWTDHEAFPYNSEEYDIGYPFISDDNQRLYFASRNPQGYGKFDLYYSDNRNGEWLPPVNLGPVINTSESEVFPFLYMGNRLYFASAGQGGQGGLEILYSDLVGNEWSKPVLMPRPFNSRYDDFGFVANAAIDTGYFASNRRGTDDIYLFVSTFPAFSECPQQVEESFCYEFYEAGTMALDTTTLRYEWDLGDGTKIRDVRASHCFAEPGFYLVRLNVIDTLTGDVYYSEASYDLTIEPVEQPYTIAPDTAFINEDIDFDASQSTIKSFTVKNYYWDFGDGTIENEIKVRHRYTRDGTYIVRLGLTGSGDESQDDEQKACSNRTITILRR